MLTVEVKIGRKKLLVVDAVRQQTNAKEYNDYKITIPDYMSIDFETGKVTQWKKIGMIRHKYKDGANVLAQEMLKMLEEYKNGNTI